MRYLNLDLDVDLDVDVYVRLKQDFEALLPTHLELKICLSPLASHLERLLAAHARQRGTKQLVRSRPRIAQNEDVRQHIRVRGRQERRPCTMTHPILQAHA